MTRLRSSLLSFLMVMPGVFAGAKDPAVTAPAYDTKTETQFEAIVGEARQVSSGALIGTFLTVKYKGESLDVYLGPDEFVKLFEVQFKAGHEVQVTGSKVKFEGKDLILAREVEIGKVTLRLRDGQGSPNWLWMKKSFPTGL